MPLAGMHCTWLPFWHSSRTLAAQGVDDKRGSSHYAYYAQDDAGNPQWLGTNNSFALKHLQDKYPGIRQVPARERSDWLTHDFQDIEMLRQHWPQLDDLALVTRALLTRE